MDRADLMIARKAGGRADIETWKTGDESSDKTRKGARSKNALKADNLWFVQAKDFINYYFTSLGLAVFGPNTMAV